jgi:Zn finger protein HypA/HybF involved in hydrogenase expression
MLYEDFMLRHLDEPALLADKTLPLRNELKRWLKRNPKVKQLTEKEHNAPPRIHDNTIISQWSNSAHAITAVNCQDCHQSNETRPFSHIQLNKSCNNCHQEQFEQFNQSQHGIRLGLDLTPMTPEQARLTMRENVQTELTCSTCHDPHSLDTVTATIDACLNCHNDEHSTNYKASPHFKLWQKERNGELPEGSGVTCASCHLPRLKKGKKVTVDHNQSAYMRPSNKVLRKVCMNCHGLEFSLSALIDEKLINNNFNGSPNQSLKAIELLKARLKQRKQRQNTDN